MSQENGLNPYPAKYRVIAQGSAYYNEVGTLLNHKRVKEKYLYVFGRNPGWYDNFPCLLAFLDPLDPEEDFSLQPGVGFAWDEVERVYE